MCRINYKFFSLLVGFLIWLLATLAFRFVGQFFFLTDKPIVMTGLYVAVVPILGFTATWVFNRYRLNSMEVTLSAVLMILPGMILDTFCIAFFAWVFPNMMEKDAATFGSWLMWAYATVLVFGLMRKDKT